LVDLPLDWLAVEFEHGGSRVLRQHFYRLPFFRRLKPTGYGCHMNHVATVVWVTLEIGAYSGLDLRVFERLDTLPQALN
jgi:hypothetical protein